jgi:hypothetical protein
MLLTIDISELRKQKVIILLENDSEKLILRPNSEAPYWVPNDYFDLKILDGKYDRINFKKPESETKKESEVKAVCQKKQESLWKSFLQLWRKKS